VKASKALDQEYGSERANEIKAALSQSLGPAFDSATAAILKKDNAMQILEYLADNPGEAAKWREYNDSRARDAASDIQGRYAPHGRTARARDQPAWMAKGANGLLSEKDWNSRMQDLLTHRQAAS
jgi:hypothetical protein